MDFKTKTIDVTDSFLSTNTPGELIEELGLSKKAQNQLTTSLLLTNNSTETEMLFTGSMSGLKHEQTGLSFESMTTRQLNIFSNCSLTMNVLTEDEIVDMKQNIFNLEEYVKELKKFEEFKTKLEEF